MIHYWGAAAIVQRIGLSRHSAKRLPLIMAQSGLPAFLRRSPGHQAPVWYASETMISLWEMSRGKQAVEQVIGELESGLRYNAGRWRERREVKGRPQARKQVA